MKKRTVIRLLACVLLVAMAILGCSCNDAANDTEGNIAEVIVAKNRHGSTGTVKVGWIGRYTKFRSIAEAGSVPEA